MKISEQYYSLKNNIVFCLAVPLFMMLFMVIYHPTFFGEADLFTQAWEVHDSFFLPIICAIVLVVLAISRSILCFALVRHSLSRREFLLWQGIEVVVACLFSNLFLSLYLHCGYFALLPRILLIGIGLVIIRNPYGERKRWPFHVPPAWSIAMSLHQSPIVETSPAPPAS